MDTVGHLLGPAACVRECVCMTVCVSEREACDILLIFTCGETVLLGGI